MKRMISLLLLLILLLALSACGKTSSVDTAVDTPPVEGVQELTYYNGTCTLRFALDENGQWIWTDGPTLPLDDTTLLTILDQLPSLSGLVSIKTEEDLSEYGLAAPTHYIIAKSGDTTSTFYFGTQASSGDWYMRTEDGESVYQAPNSLIQLLDRNIYDMVVLPTVPAWDAENVQMITVTCGEDSYYLSLTDGRWMAGSRDVTDSVPHLLEELSSLIPHRCIDYSPADGAAEICGLSSPSVTVSVKYLNSVGQDTLFTVALGTAIDPENTEYYATLGESSSIYAIPAESLTTVLKVAESGV